MLPSRNRGLDALEAAVNSDRQKVRNKLHAMLGLLNGGSGTFSVMGFSFNVYDYAERELAKLSDEKVKEVLRILRE